MQKFICIHGHFYQPPRENPWLEGVELQDSAYPYHDWNERITAECYAPNATARIYDSEGRIERITNNYSKISFNIGPTLLAWMKEKSPEVHDAIVEADVRSRERFSGHGSALAQVYNHMILPLSNSRDKRTQVIWGIRDFETRFGRKPEGMWLAETAVDAESLDALAENGIQFTILSPFQASRFREIGARHWRDVNGGRIDPTRAYEARLPSKRKISLFFYDAPVSQAVAFEGLLDSGERLANRLMSAFNDKRQWEQLVHIATDGESYGHHHRYGEMALAYALQHIESENLARLTNYAEYLETHPPAHEVQIHDKSAWSCSHGVGRWFENCGCNSGGRSGWNQHWRAPLRQALDWLRDEVAPHFERAGAELFADPWEARNGYIDVILDRSPESVDAFFGRFARRELSDAEKATAFKLLELQRHALLMYTSCGWFFDELSGIETVQVVQYAGRAIQLAQELFGQDFESGFLDRLQQAKSNIPAHRDGRTIYRKFVKPAMVDLDKVVAHYAVSSLFEPYGEKVQVYIYTFEREDHQIIPAGRAKLCIGRARVAFEVTRESAVFSYGVLHFGDHNLNGGVRPFQDSESYQELERDLKEAFGRADFPEVIRAMDRHFGESSYSLKSLFRDEQRKVLDQILVSTHEDLEGRFRIIAEIYTPLMFFFKDLGAPMPSALETAATFILNTDLQREVERDEMDLARVRALLEDSQNRNLALREESLAFAAKSKMERLMDQLIAAPEDRVLLTRLSEMSEVLQLLQFEINLWKTQNRYYAMLNEVLPNMRARAEQGAEEAQEWVLMFRTLGERLGFRVP